MTAQVATHTLALRGPVITDGFFLCINMPFVLEFLYENLLVECEWHTCGN